MMRSLFAGVSGLKNHQTRMDVIGNNISNVNTVGFKKSRVTFQDMLNQTLRGASAATANRAGTNPMQVGLGMSLASIDVIHTGGSPQSTGKNTDLSIEGDGYFLLGDGNNIFYTRAGNFDFDVNNTFYHTSTGMIVKGYLADATGNISADSPLSDINLAAQASSEPKASTVVNYGKNLDSRSVAVTGPTVINGYTHSNGIDSIIDLKGVITDVSIAGLTEGTDYKVDYSSGKIIISENVADGNYDITYTKAHYQAPISVFDSKGETHLATAIFTKIADNVWEVDTVLDGMMLSDGKGILTFSPSDGRLVNSTVTNFTATIPGADALNIALNFDNITEYAGDFTIYASGQDGYESGDLTGITVDTTGTITGSFSNGQSRKLAQIALATFANPSGLMKVGNNMFQPSNNSGIADIGLPGVSSRGIIKPETLEMSNVDLSEEFVDMIITQRGFQANSRVITTSDQILEELVNLRR
ncbi:MAG: flagellar hook protein FlgE [Peptococcia bacterium]